MLVFDRDQSALHGVRLPIEGQALLDTADLILADNRDRERVQEVFDQYRPEGVFRTAALKHLTLLENHPSEGKNQHRLNSESALCSVTHAHLLATDRQRRASRDCASRYPYDLTIPEACRLVLQAGAIGEAGEIMILDMGEPVKIVHLAEQPIRQSGKQIEIQFTGLRQGEKLHEVLVSRAEVGSVRDHARITHTNGSASLEIPDEMPASVLAKLGRLPFFGSQKSTAESSSQT